MRNKRNLRVDTSFSAAVKGKQNFPCSWKRGSRSSIPTIIFTFLICLGLISMALLMRLHSTFIDQTPNNDDLKVDFDSDYVSEQNENENALIAKIPDFLTESSTEMNIRRLEDNMNILESENVSNPLENCSPTVQIKLYQNRSSSEWYIQSLDKRGKEKIIGGDEFYISYTEESNGDQDTVNADHGEIEPTAVAFIHDLNNGKYKLDFVMTPMAQKQKSSITNTASKTGRIIVHFEYTCGIGRLSQPTKQNWKSSGMMHQESFYSDYGIRRPPIREFNIPSPSVNFSKYSSVMFFGDSTMYQLVVKERVEKPDKSGEENVYFQGNVNYVANVRSELTTERFRKFFLRKLTSFHGKQLRLQSNVALVIGSSIWDLLIADNIQGDEFDDHLQACREFILAIRERWPKVDLYWKGTSSLHPHRVDCNEANYDYQDCLNSTKYLSNSRVVNLEEKQRTLMEELKVPYMDLYPAYYLSAYYMAPGDGRHSVPALNEQILSWFYK